MDYTQFISIIALAGILIAIVSGITCLSLARKLREAEEHQMEIEKDIETLFKEIRYNLDTVVHHTNEQWNRIAKVETSIVQEREPEPVIEAVPAATSLGRQSMTERRHQVLTLAKRGMDVQSIAMTLGVPRGEVALIIGMNTSNIKV